MSDTIGEISIHKRDDGRYTVHAIRWDGTPWDGFWQDKYVDEMDVQRLLAMFPIPDVPKSCKECECGLDIGNSQSPMFFCRLDIARLIDYDWENEIPYWCPIKKAREIKKEGNDNP